MFNFYFEKVIFTHIIKRIYWILIFKNQFDYIYKKIAFYLFFSRKRMIPITFLWRYFNLIFLYKLFRKNNFYKLINNFISIKFYLQENWFLLFLYKTRLLHFVYKNIKIRSKFIGKNNFLIVKMDFFTILFTKYTSIPFLFTKTDFFLIWFLKKIY